MSSVNPKSGFRGQIGYLKQSCPWRLALHIHNHQNFTLGAFLLQASKTLDIILKAKCRIYDWNDCATFHLAFDPRKFFAGGSYHNEPGFLGAEQSGKKLIKKNTFTRHGGDVHAIFT